MKAVIISSNSYLDKRVERILVNSDINVDISKQLSRNAFNMYDCIIFSYKNEIPNIPKVIEMIVLEKKILVLYINNVPSIGQFYSLLNQDHFSLIREMTMEVELPLIIKNTCRYLNKIGNLTYELNKLTEENTLIKKTGKAKRVLISKGLSEDESHKFIQQKSMDLRISKQKLVNLIIENKIDI
jgi:response regulator NasT